MPYPADPTKYVASCAHDDVCDHGRSLDWACKPCGRELPEGMEVCWCGEPEHHMCHHPSDWFKWHGFGPSDPIAEQLALETD